MDKDLLKYFERQEFKQDLRFQLEKDIEGAADVLEGCDMDSFEHIYDLLLPLTEDCMKDTTRWMRIINRVDLNERQLKNISSMEGSYSEKMTKAILMRVFQKIALRWSNK
ncbi:hypothetical protein N9J24_02685 [Bacteroidia bacterium]|jgi:hypothetical protein|nr:hypothetical protein [Bacteroidia bacterium]